MKKRDKKKRLRKKRDRLTQGPVAKVVRVEETGVGVHLDVQALPTPAGDRFFELLKKKLT